MPLFVNVFLKCYNNALQPVLGKSQVPKIVRLGRRVTLWFWPFRVFGLTSSDLTIKLLPAGTKLTGPRGSEILTRQSIRRLPPELFRSVTCRRERGETIGDEQIVASGGRFPARVHTRRRREGQLQLLLLHSAARNIATVAHGHARTHTTRLGPVATAAAAVVVGDMYAILNLLFYNDVTTFL